MDLELFLGRFHPLVVHFPIGLLVIAFFFEYLSGFSKFKKLSAAVPYLLLAGSVSALVSVILGWLVAADRGYAETVLFWHRWLGVSVVILSVLLTVCSFSSDLYSRQLKHILFFAVFVAIGFTGHLGGTLTHGEGYLTEYAPEFLRVTFASRTQQPRSLPDNPDSIQVFDHLIRPILEAHCTECHDQGQKKGGLDLSSLEGMARGGDSGPAYVPNDPFASELFQRITLPSDHRKFMPLRSEALSYGEISLIYWWIDQGASAESTLAAMHPTEEISSVLIRDYSIDPAPKPIYEVLSLPAPSKEILEGLQKKAVLVKPLAGDNNFLQLKFSQNSQMDEETIALLDQIRKNVTWVDISRTAISSEYVNMLAGFTHLTDLNASWIGEGDEIVEYILQLKYLTKINFTGTRITEESLNKLNQLSSLTKLYLWQSGLEKSQIQQFSQKNASIAIVTAADHFE